MTDTATTALGRMPYHVGIATNDLEAAMAALSGLLLTDWTPVVDQQVGAGLATPDAPADHWRVRRTHSLAGPLRVELLEGSPGSTWATDQLAQVHHLAYWSDDVTSDAELLMAQGWTLEVTYFDDHGRPQSFAYLGHPESTRIELLDSSARPAYLELVGEATPT
jgi:hypothetical protein